MEGAMFYECDVHSVKTLPITSRPRRKHISSGSVSLNTERNNKGCPCKTRGGDERKASGARLTDSRLFAASASWKIHCFGFPLDVAKRPTTRKNCYTTNLYYYETNEIYYL